jgi:hypothetical protein
MAFRLTRCSGCASVFREHCKQACAASIGYMRYTKRRRAEGDSARLLFHVFADLLTVVSAIKRFEVGEEEVIVIVVDPQE